MLAHRSATAFAGILGTLFRGHGYVPLSPFHPPERTRTMLEQSGALAVVVDAGSLDHLRAVAEGFPRPLVLLAPELADPPALPPHRVLGARDLEPAEAWTPPDPVSREERGQNPPRQARGALGATISGHGHRCLPQM